MRRADEAGALLRALPGVDALVTRVEGHAALAGITRRRLTEAARDVLAAERRRVLEGAPAAAAAEALAERVVTRLSQSGVFSLARVVNATGVVLHTNLGRALLSPLARERLQAVAGAYSNLEMDVNRKERGSRYAHVDALLQRLTGAQSSLVVNNCAAAVLLALESLARGKEVIVSRGELIEIGGEFRIPDIMRRSGATLREVGT
ncbi:MAG: L-seryl-tRNA(Sec) selenium transferase, partial [Candidatus Rokubacteria bacterium]|nr:L-seryl-tRNA(Sec) selenium transferase [Candidatus Rokubacteria bacterium]